MTTQTEALKLALEALENLPGFLADVETAITAIKEALAQPEHHTLTSRVNDVRFHKERDEQRAEAMKMLVQPEQEPVAWMDIDEKGAASGLRYWSEPENRHEVALYTAPHPVGFAVMQKPWVGLTDEEIRKTCVNIHGGYEQARVIEAKLKEKNT